MNEQVEIALGGHGFATVTSTQVGAVSDIAKRLRMKADMIHMGERIQWGSETALMYEAADYIDAVNAKL